MATGRLILATIMALMLGPWVSGGAAMAAPVHPIVAFSDPFNESRPDGYFLGASAGGQWVKPETAAGLVPGGENYRLYALSGEAGQGIGNKPAKGEPPCGETWYVTLSPFHCVNVDRTSC